MSYVVGLYFPKPVFLLCNTFITPQNRKHSKNKVFLFIFLDFCLNQKKRKAKIENCRLFNKMRQTTSSSSSLPVKQTATISTMSSGTKNLSFSTGNAAKAIRLLLLQLYQEYTKLSLFTLSHSLSLAVETCTIT